MIANGTLLRAAKRMRAWSNDLERGYDGPWVEVGDIAIVLSTWIEGKRVRLRVLSNDRIMLFSHVAHTVALNWEVARPAMATPSET